MHGVENLKHSSPTKTSSKLAIFYWYILSSKGNGYLNSTQLIQDFNSNKKHSKFPDYAKDYIKEYIFLLGIDGAFSSIYNYIVYYDIEKGILEEKRKCIERIYIQIKKYKEGLESGVLKDLSDEEINCEAFSNIENVEMIISEYLDCYLDINPVGISKITKTKYEKNVDKDFPGLRKLIDTLSYYNHEVIKY